MDKINIAIDGHSSCGKSTMAKTLASRIGYIYIDTGAMYRGVTLYTLRHNLWQPLEDEEKESEAAQNDPFVVRGCRLDVETLISHLNDIRLTFGRVNGQNHLFLNDEDVETDIRGMKVSAHVSPVSTIPEVRKYLVRQQQAMARRKGTVMDGRDIGTVVLPHAELKVFVTARPEVRAQRRLDELHSKGIHDITYDEVLANVVERDRIDSTREASPLRKAPDARLLDNSDLTIPQQDKKLYQWYLTAAMKSATEL